MSTNVSNQVAYLRTTREFPEELHQLCVEVNKSYLDVAQAVNSRTIGLFTVNRPAITGESWYFTTKRQQSLRQAFAFTTTAAIMHGIDISQVDRVTRGFGAYTDGTNWYGLIFGTSVAIPGQISFYITPTQIVFLVGAGAPALTKGNIVIEWLSQV